ncbi:MAG TPA: MBL fold metallo-hydrolase [Xanthobacteraceae bacterium]|jgi:glyoxylase-like metal-dependent hydrolase (beta-lactamase superfamily II)|nr:MBL fold metallo-hydrolase [Xanthobacteraceae bacterium]
MSTSIRGSGTISRRTFSRRVVQSLAVVAALGTGSAMAQSPAAKDPEVTFREVAPGLYFLFDFASSNSVVLVTDEGVLVIDTRQHPRDAEDLLARIRKITDKPIKWVVNSHFHGDHTYGNSVFKAEGATIIAQRETARLMQQVADKEFARRQAFFKRRGYDPKEVKLVLPDVTFENDVTIRLGGREAHLMYFGPGQNPGDTFVLFPHARMLFTPGAFGKRSLPNMAFTPSVDNWIALLEKVAKMDVDKILPAHGDVAVPADVAELAKYLREDYDLVTGSIAKGMTLDEAEKTLTIPQYSNWRNYNRRPQEIKSLYELLQSGKRSYFER